MGGSTTTTQNGSSQSINEIPTWVQNAGQQNYGLAQQVASQPLQQYQGQMVADVSPQMQQGWDLAANSGSVGVGAQSAGQAGAYERGELHTAECHVGAAIEHRFAALHEPVHSGRDQRDAADHAAEPGAVAEPAAERGEQRQRVRRQSAGHPARRHSGARRDGHGPDGGGTRIRRTSPRRSREPSTISTINSRPRRATRPRAWPAICRASKLARRWATSAANRCRTTSPSTAC